MGFELLRKRVTVPSTNVLIATCGIEMDAAVMHADRHFDLMAKHINLKVESYVDQKGGIVQ